MKFLRLFILIFSLLFVGRGSIYARSYPVKEVEGIFCGNEKGICKITLPHIDKANYLKYKNIFPYNQIYTVLWGGTYFGGWDFGFGSHQGVDIASTIGTPIFAMGDGKVIQAQERGNRGKVVVIEHSWKGHVLYSVYAHLEKIQVKVGDSIKEGDRIGEMGSSGNSTGPHLHRQIDIKEDGEHPFFPKACDGSISEVVNEARCWNQVKVNTIDPILFLETNGTVFLSEYKKEDNTSLHSDFLSPHDLHFSLSSSVMKLGKGTQLEINAPTIKNAFLRDDIIFTSDDQVEVFPSKISYIGEKRQITIYPQTAGLHTLQISSNEKLIKTLPLFVIDEKIYEILEKKSENNPALKAILSTL